MIYTGTLCYNNPKVIEESIDKYYELCYNKPDIHFLLNDHYPLYKEEIKTTLKKLSDKYGCVILDPEKNLGLKDGSLYIMDQLNKLKGFKEEDIGIMYDSNCYPLTKNFDKALVDIYKNKDIGICTLSPQNIIENVIIKDETSNLNYIEDINFFTAITSFTYKAHSIIQASFNMFSKTYGDGSVKFSNVKDKIAKYNLKYVALSDYKEDMKYFKQKEDYDYINYKKFILNIKPKDYISFDDFLNYNYKLIPSDIIKINKEIFYFTGDVF